MAGGGPALEGRGKLLEYWFAGQGRLWWTECRVHGAAVPRGESLRPTYPGDLRDRYTRYSLHSRYGFWPSIPKQAVSDVESDETGWRCGRDVESNDTARWLVLWKGRYALLPR